MPRKSSKGEKDASEELTLAGSELVERVKKLVAEGNVRRLIVKKSSGEVLLEIPLTAGLAAGGAMLWLTPVLAALGALAALVAEVRLEIVRPDRNDDKE
jgi:hypothetical protein